MDENGQQLLAMIDELTADAQPLELTAQDYEALIAMRPPELERIVNAILVDQLDEAMRIYAGADGEGGLSAVTEFLLRGLFVFVAGYQRFDGYGQLVMLRREGLRVEDSPALGEALREKVEACRPIVGNVVRRFAPLLDDPGAKMGDLPI